MILIIIYRLSFRQNDLFDYFKELAKAKQLPSFEVLKIIARNLYQAYTSSQAQYCALYDTEGWSEWSQIVPLGTGPVAEESSINIGITANKPRVPKSSIPTAPQESSAGDIV
jgi:hypothetical protein